MAVFPVPRTAHIYPVSALTPSLTILYLGRWLSSGPKKAASTAKRGCGRYGGSCLLRSTRMLLRARTSTGLRIPWAAVRLSPRRPHDICGRRTKGSSWAGASPRDTLNGRSLKSMLRTKKPVSLSFLTQKYKARPRVAQLESVDVIKSFGISSITS